jgi:copper chaperone
MSVTFTVAVEGMTCGHCVSAVTKEVTELEGVSEVSVELEPEGQTLVTISAEVDIPRSDVVKAIAEAGYSVVEA